MSRVTFQSPGTLAASSVNSGLVPPGANSQARTPSGSHSRNLDIAAAYAIGVRRWKFLAVPTIEGHQNLGDDSRVARAELDRQQIGGAINRIRL